MKFLEAIETKLKLLEQDAAVPQDNTADASQPTADSVDAIGQQANQQVLQNIKTCADIVNALVVFVNGKFADQIAATPGLEDQLKELEQQTTITDVDSVTPKLLQDILNAVRDVKGL